VLVLHGRGAAVVGTLKPCSASAVREPFDALRPARAELAADQVFTYVTPD
jgi:hypothetical protein